VRLIHPDSCSIRAVFGGFKQVPTPVGRQNIARLQNQSLGDKVELGYSDKILAMIVSLRHLLGWIFSVVSSREDLILENLALRQQLLALHAKRPQRRLTGRYKLFWVMLRKL